VKSSIVGICGLFLLSGYGTRGNGTGAGPRTKAARQHNAPHAICITISKMARDFLTAGPRGHLHAKFNA